MPLVTGQGTTFNMPNYVGDLFAVTPTETPFLSAIGGLTGGQPADATLFQWQGKDRRAADATRQRLEGADAPTAEQRSRFNVTNVVEIHQESLDISYTKLAATGQFNSTGSANAGSVGLNGTNPVLNELAEQTNDALITVAQDIEKSFLVGKFSNPASNASARKTRGIIEATTSNVLDKATLVGAGAATIATTGVITETGHGLAVGDAVTPRALTTGAIGVIEEDSLYYVLTAPSADTFTIGTEKLADGGTTITFDSAGVADFYEAAPLDKASMDTLFRKIFNNGGMARADTRTIMCGSVAALSLTDIYIKGAGYQEGTRNVGGVDVQTIGTQHGTVNVMINRFMPTAMLQLVSLDQCAPRFLPIPGKGYMFMEPLAKTGASEKAQIYGEVGLKYGNEKTHGKILGVSAAA